MEFKIFKQSEKKIFLNKFYINTRVTQGANICFKLYISSKYIIHNKKSEVQGGNKDCRIISFIYKLIIMDS